MVRLPPDLERKLASAFPRLREREKFVAETLDEALFARPNLGLQTDENTDDVPSAVGGTLHLFSDGGSRGNPGNAAIGVILEDPARGVTLQEFSERIGTETNNVAEYRALIAGLRLARKFHPNRLICHLDSELIVRQMNGQYQVKMATLQPLHEDVRRLSMEFPDVVFKHIPRSDNHRADALVNKALDAGLG